MQKNHEVHPHYNSNVVLMSATPNYEFIEILEELSGKEIITIDIKYDDKDAHKKKDIR